MALWLIWGCFPNAFLNGSQSQAQPHWRESVEGWLKLSQAMEIEDARKESLFL